MREDWIGIAKKTLKIGTLEIDGVKRYCVRNGLEEILFMTEPDDGADVAIQWAIDNSEL